MTTLAYSPADAREIATVIKRQFGVMALACLGASDFVTLPEGGLRFTARILPFTKTGKRSGSARKMTVEVTLNPLDYYDVKVYWLNKFAVVEHYSTTDVDAFSLERLAVALDYDGNEVLNPRI